MRLIVFCFFFIANLNLTFGQDQIAKKMTWYNKIQPSTNLFVHFDKNVYANNETAYFTGYLIKAGANPAATHKIMAVALIRDADSTIIIEDRFIMQDGLSLGSITIPDSVFTGNYRFLAYTDKLTNGIPDLIYEQAITLKTNIDPEYKASMKIMEDPNNSQKVHKVLISATTKQGFFLPKPTTITYKYGSINVTTKTDLSGQLLLSLPKQNNLTDPNLYVNLKYANESSFITMPLPQTKGKASVKFYPEGGNLIEGLYANIGWEAKDQQNKPMALKAMLYKNNEVIDTIETSSYGIGQFKLLTEKNSTYSLKLIHDGIADSTYYLPKPIDKGLTLIVGEAIVQDTLKLTLKTNGTRNLLIRLHNFRESYVNIPFDMVYNSRTIKIPLTGIPKGLTALTVTDTLNRPLAERIFFAHYSNAKKLDIDVEKRSYTQREKVNLKLKLNGIDEQAVVSIAVVQNNRLDLKISDDIESYSYLKNELSNLPTNLNGTAYKDKNYLEQILLVKGWRRYTWQDLHKINATDTTLKTDSLIIAGITTKAKKQLISPITIGTLGGINSRLITTNDNGTFDLNSPNFITEAGKKLYLFIGEKNKFSYQIQINDPFIKMSNQLSKNLLKETPTIPSTILNNAELVIKGNEKSIRLKEVEIKSNKDNSMNYGKAYRTNGAGDYVCLNGILNCRNHVNDPGNRPAISGATYTINGIKSIYREITTPKEDPTLIKINGIHSPKEFYLDDYKDPQEPAFFSTIYWNYATILNSNKEVDLSFYTGDIVGKFRVVVQGISNKDVIYGEQLFEVKPKINP